MFFLTKQWETSAFLFIQTISFWDTLHEVHHPPIVLQIKTIGGKRNG